MRSCNRRDSSLFTRAIVRTPGHNFAAGLTTVKLGVPKIARVLAQHASYCDALEKCGLTLTTLEADLGYPDSTFVEDVAVLTGRVAILARPGAPSRAGEVEAIRPVVESFFPATFSIEAPGTLDGGDICEAENHFYIGLSHRTNQEGARQLTVHLGASGYTSSIIDIRAMSSILHFKSGVSYIGENVLVVIEEMATDARFSKFDLISVGAEESYAANCVRVNDRVLIADGYPGLQRQLVARGFKPLALDMSEFQKMDGGLSCLSLRF